MILYQLKGINKMKKRFIYMIVIIIMTILTTGCSFVKDNLENAKICTTIYPVQFLTDKLYGEHSTIESIYPQGADIDNYRLTSKQIKEYAKNNLFIYNGLTNEKNIAKNLINKNKNLLIIDIANGLNYKYDLKELWMSPYNYLMLAKNIKEGLNDYLKSSIIKKEVNKNYNELAEKLSLMDADLRSIAREANKNNKETLLVTDDLFYYLQDYGFKIVSLDPDTRTESTINNVNNDLKKKKYNAIIILDNTIDDEINNIIDKHKISQVNISSMIDEPENNDNYINQMQTFIDSIRNLCIKD